MRVVVQRVTRAGVRVSGETIAAIGPGLLVLVGFGTEERPDACEWMADKVLGLRIFGDANGRMNRSVSDMGGGVLVVSQFTLYGDVSRGRRPSFVAAAEPSHAEASYEAFIAALRARAAGRVHSGRFGANMQVELENDGPVTLIIER